MKELDRAYRSKTVKVLLLMSMLVGLGFVLGAISVPTYDKETVEACRKMARIAEVAVRVQGTERPEDAKAAELSLIMPDYDQARRDCYDDTRMKG